MMQNDILLKHLSTIVDPELGVDIVELGMVKDISFVESTVVIKLALTIAECPMRNQIETEIINLLNNTIFGIIDYGYTNKIIKSCSSNR
ncbi:MAG: iron-sulfur cluster assembly protein [Candidatus Actinomarina sp.]|nr:iron-sulfur cluster assembly protein [Candidatus Actinomarina sp.]